jgi:divalent metal cation (Fe/Co/Zn/Cd) transporter
MTYIVTIHVQADPTLSSRDAHILAGNVEGETQAAAPQVASVLVHMEPFGESSAKFGDSGTSVRAS